LRNAALAGRTGPRAEATAARATATAAENAPDAASEDERYEQAEVRIKGGRRAELLRSLFCLCQLVYDRNPVLFEVEPIDPKGGTAAEQLDALESFLVTLDRDRRELFFDTIVELHNGLVADIPAGEAPIFREWTAMAAALNSANPEPWMRDRVSCEVQA